MARKVTIYLDKALRDDQMFLLAEHALEWGLQKARTRVAAYESGKKRPKRRNLTSVAKIAEDLGMTLKSQFAQITLLALQRRNHSSDSARGLETCQRLRCVITGLVGCVGH